MTQLWEAVLTRSGEQLQPQSKLWTTSPSGLRGCCDVIHLEKGSVVLKCFKNCLLWVFQGCFSDTTPGHGWQVFPRLTAKAEAPGGCPAGPSLCSHLAYAMSPTDSLRTDWDALAGVSPRPLQFCSLAQSHGISSISALGISTSLFLSFCFPLNPSQTSS